MDIMTDELVIISNVLAFLGCLLTEFAIRRWTTGLQGTRPMYPAVLLVMVTNLFFVYVLSREPPDVPGTTKKILEHALVSLQSLSVVRSAMKKDFKSASVSVFFVIAHFTCLWPLAMFAYMLGGIVFGPYVGAAVAPVWHGMLCLFIIYHNISVAFWFRLIARRADVMGPFPGAFLFVVMIHAWLSQQFHLL